jgi:hypothetical protein
MTENILEMIIAALIMIISTAAAVCGYASAQKLQVGQTVREMAQNHITKSPVHLHSEGFSSFCLSRLAQ